MSIDRYILTNYNTFGMLMYALYVSQIANEKVTKLVCIRNIFIKALIRVGKLTTRFSFMHFIYTMAIRKRREV